MAKEKETTSKKTGTHVATCTCSHVYQDRMYGMGKRVFNAMKNGKSRCTVCGAVK